MADVCERSELDSAAYFLGLLRTIVENKQNGDTNLNTAFDLRKRLS